MCVGPNNQKVKCWAENSHDLHSLILNWKHKFKKFLKWNIFLQSQISELIKYTKNDEQDIWIML